MSFRLITSAGLGFLLLIALVVIAIGHRQIGTSIHMAEALQQRVLPAIERIDEIEDLLTANERLIETHNTAIRHRAFVTAS